MARFRLPLSVMTAIAAFVLLLSSALTAQACLFKGSEQSLIGAFSQSGTPSRVSDAARLPTNLGSLSLMDMSEVAGLGVLVGLFTFAIFYKVRHVRKLAPSEAALLSKYPFLEHPEMVLALVPQEALPSVFETEVVQTRW